MQLMSGVPWETVTLTTLSRDRVLFPYLLSEARDLAMRGHEGKLVIHTAWGTEWRPFGQPRQKRPLHSVVLGSNIAENIEKDIKAFLDRRQWYSDRGLSILCCFDILRMSVSTFFSRNSLSQRVSITWTPRLWQDIVYPGTCRSTLL
jgi:hypothetical protein